MKIAPSEDSHHSNGGGGGTLVFSEERRLIFRSQFLTIIISTNKVVFNAEHPMRIRVVMLTTEGKGFLKFSLYYMSFICHIICQLCVCERESERMRE